MLPGQVDGWLQLTLHENRAVHNCRAGAVRDDVGHDVRRGLVEEESLNFSRKGQREMIAVRSTFVFLLGLPVLFACGSGDDGGPKVSAPGGTSSVGGDGAAAGGSGNVGGTGGASGSGGSGGSGGVGGNASGGSTCSPYPNDAPTVTGTIETGAPPVMTGGIIVDGKYWLTAMKHYGSGTPNVIAERIDISGAGTYYDDVSQQNGGELRNGTSMTVNGNMASFRIVCGLYEGTTGTVPYSASPTQFSTLLPNQELKIYSKQ